MIAGLPAATWVLMLVSVVPGVVLVALAWRAHRGDAAASRARRSQPDADDA